MTEVELTVWIILINYNFLQLQTSSYTRELDNILRMSNWLSKAKPADKMLILGCFREAIIVYGVSWEDTNMLRNNKYFFL